MKSLQWIHDFDVSIVRKVIASDIYLKILPISSTLSRTGDGWYYLFIGLFSLLINGINHLYFWSLLIGFGIERSLYYLTKNTLKRTRPFKIIAIKFHIIPNDTFSFPSGHTSSAFLFALISSSFYPILLVPLLLWAAMVGLSRIVLGVHFPTDVLMGMALGLGVAKLTSRII